MAERSVIVLDPGPQTVVQDLGRPGWAHLGVPRSGALDEPAHRLANRLVGNPESAATLECLGGGLRLRVGAAMAVAVTGARAPVSVNGRAREWATALSVPAGASLVVGVPESGLRSYLAVAGGIAADPVLGSRSTDLLSGLGPAVLAQDTVLAVGPAVDEPVPSDVPRLGSGGGVLRLRLGPRADWFSQEGVETLAGATYVVSSSSNRVGLRLEGPALARSRTEELPSEPIVLGAVQVPPNGQPVVFLNDHPTTGGYPVLGVVFREDLARCAQLRPGEEVRFRVVRD